MTRRVLLIAFASLVCVSAADASEPAHAPAKPKPSVPAAAAPAPKTSAHADAGAPVATVEEPVAPQAKSKKTPFGRTSTGETLEELVARVRRRIAEQQATSNRRPATAGRGHDAGEPALHLEWRPGVTWPTELLPPIAGPSSEPTSDGRVTIDWGKAAAEDDGRVSVEWGSAP